MQSPGNFPTLNGLIDQLTSNSPNPPHMSYQRPMQGPMTSTAAPPMVQLTFDDVDWMADAPMPDDEPTEYKPCVSGINQQTIKTEPAVDEETLYDQYFTRKYFAAVNEAFTKEHANYLEKTLPELPFRLNLSKSDFEPKPIASSSNAADKGERDIKCEPLSPETQSTAVTISSRTRPGVIHVVPKEGTEIIGRLDVRKPDEVGRPWADILYYEYKEKIGSEYYAAGNSVIIDGLCQALDPSRFCLGSTGPPRAQRENQSAVTAVRAQIGKGVELTCDDGIVTLRCLCESPVFMQSPMTARLENDHQATVYRLAGVKRDPVTGRWEKPYSITMFDENQFKILLEEARSSGYQTLYDLQNFCTARVSFVKGFGSQYRRQSILETPCWISIRFTRCLKLLDDALASVDSPNSAMRSFS